MCLAACSFERGTVLDGGPPGDVAPTDMATDAPVSLLIEAEAPTTTISADGYHAWTPELLLGGYTGTGYITALPHDFNQCIEPEQTWCGAYNTYSIEIPVTGMYRVTVRYFSTSGATDSVHWYLGAAAIDENLNPDMTPVWTDDVDPIAVDVRAGHAELGLRMRETGTSIDSIRLDLVF